MSHVVEVPAPMDVILVRSSVYALPSGRRGGAILYDGAADLQLWPGPGPDSQLREAWGDGLREFLDSEHRRLGTLSVGDVMRVNAGRLHCDFLIWIATREPEPGSSRHPAPDADRLRQAMTNALTFAAARGVGRVASPPLGHGPGELDPAERLEVLGRAAHEYEERCFERGQAPGVEEVLLCHPESGVLRRVHQRLGAQVTDTEGLSSSPQPARKGAQGERGSKRRRTPQQERGRGGGGNRRRRGLDPEELERARAQALPYDRTHTYQAGEWLRHARFGLGKVEEVLPEGAIMVRFEDGEQRRMLHARG